MAGFGPQYCETPAGYDELHPWSAFPVEPWNVWSSAVIVFARTAGLRYVLPVTSADNRIVDVC